MKTVTRGQRYALRQVISKVTENKDARLYIIRKLTDSEAVHISGVKYKEWAEIRDNAYPNWQDGDWDISKKFIGKMKKIYNYYEKVYIGQQNLFGD